MKWQSILPTALSVSKSLAAAAISYRPIRKGRQHGLQAPLIVSLTSYPSRFRILARTLRCLLNQSVAADRTILWVSDADEGALPAKVRKLTRFGLEIRTCPDWRSLKKIAPSLLAFPESYIATADDDLFYPHDWLESMVSRVSTAIVARKARNPVWLGERYAPITTWPLEGDNGRLSFLSGAGVIFPPYSLHPDTCDYAAFARLAPTCDDVWLTWHAARAGSVSQRVGKEPSLICWERTKADSLSVLNFGADFTSSQHDELVANLVREYGPLHKLKQANAVQN